MYIKTIKINDLPLCYTVTFKINKSNGCILSKRNKSKFTRIILWDLSSPVSDGPSFAVIKMMTLNRMHFGGLMKIFDL